MRKIVVLEHITLDGVIQSPGGADEDTSHGFTHGGWISNYSDPILGTALREQMNKSFDLLLGRKTFEIWEPYWPKHPEVWPGAASATKYVVSMTRTSSEWEPTVFLNGDIAEHIRELKEQDGPELHVWGSSELVQTLMEHGLVDVLWLMIYPIILGYGKRLFGKGTMPTTFKVTDGKVTPSGVIVAEYESEGVQ